MESLLKELIEVIEKNNSFSLMDAINILSVVAAWITIWFLLRERSKQNRPYLQVSFELIRSNLTCVVLRNTGNVPLSVKELQFDREFIEQLPERDRKGLEHNKIDNLIIFPGKQWIICLGVIVPEILEKYDKKVLKLDYTYSQLKRKKKYVETSEIDFEQYGRCLVYISDIDELRQVDKKIANDIESVRKDIKKIQAVVVKYANLQDANKKVLIAGYESDDTNINN